MLGAGQRDHFHELWPHGVRLTPAHATVLPLPIYVGCTTSGQTLMHSNQYYIVRSCAALGLRVHNKSGVLMELERV